MSSEDTQYLIPDSIIQPLALTQTTSDFSRMKPTLKAGQLDAIVLDPMRKVIFK